MTARIRTHYADDDTLKYVTTLEDENARLRNVLEALYGATHGYLNTSRSLSRSDPAAEDDARRLREALAGADEALRGVGAPGGTGK